VLLRLDDLSRHIGDRVLFEGVSLVVRPEDRIGLVGPNGAGKSTLLRTVAGDEPADRGTARPGKDVRLGMLRQEIDPGREHSVFDEAARALRHLDELERQMRALERQMSELDGHVDAALAERYDGAVRRFERAGGFEREARVASVLAGLGFDDAARARPLSSFSGGWLMRVELAKLLLAGPDVLLLDEPTNHLDLPAIRWFEDTLARFRGAVIVVSHDRAFLRRHANRIVELDGRGSSNLYEGNYDRYLAERDRRREELLARKKNQDRQIAEQERFIERFRYKASKARQVQSRVKALEKIERIEVEEDPGRRMRLRIPAPPRSGATVMRLEGVRKAYGDNVVYDGVDFELQRGERVALAGPNGAGKSTLLRILAGALPVDAGVRDAGHNVQVSFYAQHQLESLDAENTVLEELDAGARTGDYPRLRGHLGAFLFTGDDVDKKVSVLSGGEKARLALAKMLLHPSNLLVLDEPTNHLDIQACEVLEEALDAYQGTLVFVSHDRDFINALATRVVDVQAGRLREYLGDYDDYERKRDAEEAAERAASGREADGGAPASGPSTKEQRQRERERRKQRDRTTRQLARLEEAIHALEAHTAELEARLADPDVYADAERFQALELERQDALEQTEDRMAEWESLSAKLEALDDGDPSSG